MFVEFPVPDHFHRKLAFLILYRRTIFKKLVIALDADPIEQIVNCYLIYVWHRALIIAALGFTTFASITILFADIFEI